VSLGGLAELGRAFAGRRARWDAICRKCGSCCYEKDRRGGAFVTNWRSPCRFLEESTRLCTVYEKRFSACHECRKMTIVHALFAPYLPATCGYVRRFRRLRA
jgi:uncharacterized cysteine cluster protein YcgN (CxxCxxCC family)